MVRSGQVFPRRLTDSYVLSKMLLGQYFPHLTRQMADLRVFMEDESLILDPQMDYQKVDGLSSEVKERLGKVKPTTIVSIATILLLSSPFANFLSYL